ncbi:MAG: hypothetical protein ABEJ98_00385 [Candidatus Nanohaloarchaea archaeon]
MKVEVVPSGDKDRLAENLERRVEEVEKQGEMLLVETENPSKLGKVPGVEKFRYHEEEHEGLEGKPVRTEAYAKIESREDAVKALLATIEGYDLRVIDTEREWDLRRLKAFNPDIKQVNRESKALEIDYSISDTEIGEKIEIETPGEEDVERIYREFLT